MLGRRRLRLRYLFVFKLGIPLKNGLRAGATCEVAGYKRTASARQQVLRNFMKSLREKRTFRCSRGLKWVGGALHFLKALPRDLSLR